jgi:Matrixin
VTPPPGRLAVTFFRIREPSVAPKTRRRLTVEQLEDRLTPSTTAVPWPNPGHLTLSFAPDGTSTGQLASTLFQNLNSVTSTYAWEMAILTAYQTWADNANVNISVVNDGGESFGAPGVPQGDSRFGDIRVGMAALADTALANTTPFTWAGTTWAGDTLLNSAFNFGVNNQDGPYDLTTVMLHEAGLAFGLPDNTTDSSSVMYNQYLGVRTTLSPADIAAFQALYGTRTPDAYQGTTGDNSFATAYNFLALPASGLTLQADLGRFGEAEYYKFTALPLTTSMTVDLTTTGISSLLANVTVYNANHQAIGSETAVNPMNGNLSVTVPTSLLGGTYYIEVSGANNSVFSIGSYQMSVGTSTLLGISLPQSTYTSPISLSNPGSIITAALSLLPKWTNPNSLAFNISTYSQIAYAGQQNWFYVPAPPASTYGTAPLDLVAEAWGTNANAPLDPEVQVWSAGLSPQLLSAQVLTNSQGVFTVQLPNAASGNGYYIEVQSLASSGSGSTGQYFLGVNFHSGAPVVLTPLASGTLTQSAPQQFLQLTLNQNELWHFNLAANTGGANSAEEVQMQIYDQNGNLLFNLISYAGQPPSTECVYLLAGTYTVRIVAVAEQPDQFASLAFALSGENLSYPIGAMMTPTNSSGSSNGTAPTYSTSSSGGGTYAPPRYS